MWEIYLHLTSLPHFPVPYRRRLSQEEAGSRDVVELVRGVDRLKARPFSNRRVNTCIVIRYCFYEACTVVFTSSEAGKLANRGVVSSSFGVTVDAFTEPVRYNVHKAHPASAQGQSCVLRTWSHRMTGRGTRKPCRVEANDIQIIRDNSTTRCVQKRMKEGANIDTARFCACIKMVRGEPRRDIRMTDDYCAEHITNANHTYRDINTDMEILHIQPKSQKLNTLEQYEIYRHTKTHPNEILNTQLIFRTHTLFDSTLHYTNTPPQETKQKAPRPQRPDLMMANSRSKHNGPEVHHPPIKLSTGSFPGVKGGQSVVPTTPPHSSAEVMESMGLYLHAPQVPSWHVTGGTWFLERHCNDTPLAGQRQIQMERSLTPVSERVGVGGARDMHSYHCEPQCAQALIIQSAVQNLKVRIYKTVILPVLLYGCETWTLTLREEHRLRVFENKVLRKIFGAKRDEVTGEWRKLHNTELHALYSSPDIIRNLKSRRLRWAGHVARMGESRNAYRVLVGRPEGKRPLGRPRRRWEDNIKMDLREVGYDDRDWLNLAQDRGRWRAYVRAAMNLRVP
ncbi:hypothetical protein ANN_12500 [Periplaneta americana]|uniref:Uncharacterized protein n=1 Tax=Periplaneta americana TaxID=6978 RepID=A0ABQ8TJG2_PERAM|nr:hypothetical protein ANN_12500 [Periplaneta americana]